MQNKTFGRMMVGSASLLALALAGCGGGGGGNEGVVNGVKYTVNSAAAIAQESADDYSSNVNGIITGTTLKSWLTAWVTNRPAGITGKLIIFQVAAGPVGSEYIKPDGTNIFTYLSPSSEWIETRSNGVIETPSMVPSGATMDALMKKYNVDPSKDMIVVAMGTGSTTNAMAQGRVWYALRYWGVAKEHLAILNGGSQWLNGNGLASTDFQATATTAPNSGTFSVKSLTTVNTALQATFEDVLAITGADSNNKGDHAFLWDARSLGQYSAGEMVELGEDQDPDTTGSQACATAYCTPTSTSNYMWSFQNGGSRQGHPGGALQLQYTRMLDSTKGFAYKPKAELAAYVDGTPDASGNGLLDGSYNLVGTGNGYQPGDTVYVYCETTFRAMITGIVSAVVLGKPTRFYDGAMVEWNSLSYLLDKDGKYILPIDSPWRTDVHSFYRPATSASLVNTRVINNAYAGNAKLIVNSDRAYKTGESVPSSTGGGSMPGNPCGG
jgi:3-mercaptopyruvate sulfurtransferase SseA